MLQPRGIAPMSLFYTGNFETEKSAIIRIVCYEKTWRMRVMYRTVLSVCF